MYSSKILVRHVNFSKEFDDFSKAYLFLKNQHINIYDKECKFYPFNTIQNCFDLKNPIHIFPVAKTYKPFFSKYLSKQDYLNTPIVTDSDNKQLLYSWENNTLSDIGDETYIDYDNYYDDDDFENEIIDREYLIEEYSN